jgi:hypothetical protein
MEVTRMIGDKPATILTTKEILNLSDRLYGRGVSNITTYSAREASDLILASRALRALLRRYERAVGRELQAIMIGG